LVRRVMIMNTICVHTRTCSTHEAVAR
jgi:hypothetical protein